MRRRTRRKIYLWYSDLREIDKTLVTGRSGPELDEELARLKDTDRQVAYVDVPLSYMEEVYHLRLHRFFHATVHAPRRGRDPGDFS